LTVPAAIYLFFGFTATGKSTLAEAWARKHNLAYYNTDLIRKNLAGLPPTSRQREAVETGIYSREFSRRTYEDLLEKAEREVRNGKGVVLDGSYQKREERQRVRQLAQNYLVPIFFVLCTCPEPVLRSRLSRRARDPAAVSDGRWEIYLQQKARFEPPTELTPQELVLLDTGEPAKQVAARLEEIIRQLAQPRGKRQ
jgi:uncharacterized protein